MVTTDTAQTITADKTFSGLLTSDGGLLISGFLRYASEVQAGTTHTLQTSSEYVVRYTNSAARVITLFNPGAGDVGNQWFLFDAARTAATGNVTVQTTGGVSLNGTPNGSIVLSVNGGSVLVRVSAAGAWEVLGITAAGGGGVPTSRLISTGNFLNGGGDLTADRTISLNAGTGGGLMWYNGGGSTWASTAAGTSGQLLQSNGTSAPSWVTIALPGAFTNISGATYTLQNTDNPLIRMTNTASRLVTLYNPGGGDVGKTYTIYDAALTAGPSSGTPIIISGDGSVIQINGSIYNDAMIGTKGGSVTLRVVSANNWEILSTPGTYSYDDVNGGFQVHQGSATSAYGIIVNQYYGDTLKFWNGATGRAKLFNSGRWSFGNALFASGGSAGEGFDFADAFSFDTFVPGHGNAKLFEITHSTRSIASGAPTLRTVQKGGINAFARVISANYTVDTTVNGSTTEFDMLLLVDASGGNVTVTLPALTAGRVIKVQKILGANNSVIIQRAGSDTIRYGALASQTSFTFFDFNGYELTARGNTEWVTTQSYLAGANIWSGTQTFNNVTIQGITVVLSNDQPNGTYTLTNTARTRTRMTNASARLVTLFTPVSGEVGAEWQIHDAARTASTATLSVQAPIGSTLNGVSAGTVTVTTDGGVVVVRVTAANAWETVGS